MKKKEMRMRQLHGILWKIMPVAYRISGIVQIRTYKISHSFQMLVTFSREMYLIVMSPFISFIDEFNGKNYGPVA